MPLILNLGTRQRWMATFTLQAARLSGIISPTSQCVGGRVVSGDSLDTMKKRKISLCCWEPDHSSFIVRPVPNHTTDSTCWFRNCTYYFSVGLIILVKLYWIVSHAVFIKYWLVDDARSEKPGSDPLQDPTTLTAFLFISPNLVLIIMLLPLILMKDLCNRNQQNALFTFNLFW
jgi:hypothetical protein